jgi:hypothetical protein
MHITEADRIDMLAELRRCHGERVGDIIVAHLPPVGWGDIARQADIARLEIDIARLEHRVDRLVTAVRAAGAMIFSGFAGLCALVITSL